MGEIEKMADSIKEKLTTLLEKRKKLEETIFSGELMVRHGETQVMYRSIDDLKKALCVLDEEIATLNNTGGYPRYFSPKIRSGY